MYYLPTSNYLTHKTKLKSIVHKMSIIIKHIHKQDIRHINKYDPNNLINNIRNYNLCTYMRIYNFSCTIL